VIALRAFVLDDVPAVTTACQDPLVARFTTVPTPYGEQHARDWILGQEERRLVGRALDLAVADAVSSALLGAVGLGDIDWEHGRGEAGYWVAPEARGRGVATRALRLLTAWALGPPLGLARIQVTVDVANVPSVRTAERAGFVRDGPPRLAERKGRRWEVFVLSRQAFPDGRTLREPIPSGS